MEKTVIEGGLWTVRQTATALGCEPNVLSRLFYDGAVSDRVAPLVGGRRIVVAEHLPLIVAALRRRGVDVKLDQKPLEPSQKETSNAST